MKNSFSVISSGKPGWFFGFPGPGTGFGEIGYIIQVESSPFFVGVLLDNIILEPDMNMLNIPGTLNLQIIRS